MEDQPQVEQSSVLFLPDSWTSVNFHNYILKVVSFADYLSDL